MFEHKQKKLLVATFGMLLSPDGRNSHLEVYAVLEGSHSDCVHHKIIFIAECNGIFWVSIYALANSTDNPIIIIFGIIWNAVNPEHLFNFLFPLGDIVFWKALQMPLRASL